MAMKVGHLKDAVVITENEIAERSAFELGSAYIGDAAQPDAELFAGPQMSGHAYVGVRNRLLIDTGPCPDNETIERIRLAVSTRFWSAS